LRDLAGADELLLAVDVGDEGVEGADALLEAAREVGPFVGVEDARDDVERDEPLRIAALGLGSVLITLAATHLR
jgi:hypothetical protein